MKRSSSFLFAVLCLSVPSLLQAGEFDGSVFKERRERWMRTLGSGLAIIKGGVSKVHNNDIHQPFRQESSFFYLTGFEEPDAVLLINPSAKKKFTLFVRPRHTYREAIDGLRAGVEGARVVYGADEAFPISEFPAQLLAQIPDAGKVYYDFKDAELNALIISALQKIQASGDRTGSTRDLSFVSPRPSLDELRMIKSPLEVAALQKAIDITSDALFEGAKKAAPGRFEYQVAASVQKTFLEQGALRMGFPSIVASGPNAPIAHYMANRRKMKDGELLLLDIGAEYDYYSADVTRTFPVGARFTPEQREIYMLVLEAQEAAIRLVAPGISMEYLERVTRKIVARGLHRLGLVLDPEKDWQVFAWYWPSLGHWLGMDTHDCGSYSMADGGARSFRAGMVLTIEPGIYISDSRLDDLQAFLKSLRQDVSSAEISAFVEKVRPAFERYRDIGVRIEDDLVVTETGYRLLSGAFPRDPDEIESLLEKLRK